MERILIRSARLAMYGVSFVCMVTGAMGVHDFWNPAGDRWGPGYPWFIAWGPGILTLGILLFKLARVNIFETIWTAETRTWARRMFRYGATVFLSGVFLSCIALMAALIFIVFMLMPGAVMMFVSGVILILRDRGASSNEVTLKTERGRDMEKVAVTEDDEEVHTSEGFGPDLARSSEGILFISIFAGVNIGAFLGALGGMLLQHNSLPGVFVGAFLGILGGIIAGVVISGRRE